MLKALGITKEKKDKPTVSLIIQPSKQHWNVGESITGKVLLHTTHDFQLKTLKIQLYGVEFIGSDALNASKKPKKKVILDTHLINMFEPASKRTAIQTGEHFYPFSLLLPATIPPSLVLPDKCKVVYTIRAVADIHKLDNVEDNCQWIRIHKPNPLDSAPPAPFKDKMKQLLRGSIKLVCTTNKTSYIGGECVALQLSIENGASKEINNVTVSLVRVSKCEAEKHKDVLLWVQPDSMPIGSHKSFKEEVKLQLPGTEQMPPTAKGKIIDIEYQIQFKVDFAEGGSAWKTACPLVIINSNEEVEKPPTSNNLTPEQIMLAPTAVSDNKNNASSNSNANNDNSNNNNLQSSDSTTNPQTADNINTSNTIGNSQSDVPKVANEKTIDTLVNTPPPVNRSTKAVLNAENSTGGTDEPPPPYIPLEETPPPYTPINSNPPPSQTSDVDDNPPPYTPIDSNVATNAPSYYGQPVVNATAFQIEHLTEDDYK